MKKVLVGICDIGNGHINRQKSVISYLRSQGICVAVVTPQRSADYLQRLFPDIKIIQSAIPWITCDKEGIDFIDTLERHVKNKLDYYEIFLRAAIQIEEYFRVKPDLVISDYEPLTARYAYARSIPVICMEQQAKYIYLKNILLADHSNQEEKSRLNLFFPHTDLRIISSFFPVDNLPKDVICIPPIIDVLPSTHTTSRMGVVYFSPYYDDSEEQRKILLLIQALSDYRFILYTNQDKWRSFGCTNIIVKRFSEEFKFDLARSEFVISSSGHQLISESIQLEKPLLLFPLDTYEQNYNCRMVEKYKLGKRLELFTKNEFNEFYYSIPEYRRSVCDFKKQFWVKNWEQALTDALQTVLN